MPAPESGIVDRIRRALRSSRSAGSDVELLGRFLEVRDETAFEEILRRYGPMVYGVCRRVLGDGHAAEDAFQATFLALVSRPPQNLPQGEIAGWLYRASGRIATKMRVQSVKASVRERRAARGESVAGADPASDDVRTAIDEELSQLPSSYRQAIVLCCVLEKPLSEAARDLGLSSNAVWKRVQRGRELLQKRLRRRGLAPTAVGLGAGILSSPELAAVPNDLFAATMQSAHKLVLGCPSDVRPELLASARSIGARSAHRSIFVGIGVAFGGLVLALALSGRADTPANSEEARPDPPTEAPVRAPRTVAVIAGEVRDATGRPIVSSTVVVLAKEIRRADTGASDRTIAHVLTDENGRFRIPVPEFAALVAEDRRVKILASTADGRSVVGKEVFLPPGIDNPEPLALVLEPSQPVRGRVLDERGEPLEGASVSVVRLGPTSWEPAVGETRGPPLGWPQGCTTDPEGYFSLVGLDPNEGSKLAVEHRSAGYTVAIVPPNPSGTVEIRLGPTRRLDLRVVAADTGEPLAHSRIVVYGAGPNGSTVGRKAIADADGAISVLLPNASGFHVQAFPPEGSSYPATMRQLSWPRGSERTRSLTVAVARGIAIRGRVVEAGQGVPNAHVQFVPRVNSEYVTGGASVGNSDAEGRFALAVPAEEGTLLVHGPSLNYVSARAALSTLKVGKPEARSVYAHAIVAIEPNANRAQKPLEVVIRPAKSVACRVLDSAGRPVPSGWALCRHLVSPRNPTMPATLPIVQGKLTLPGCEPGTRYFPVLADGRGREALSTEFEMPDEGENGPDFHLGPAASLDVSLTRMDGSPAEGVVPQLALMLASPVPAGSPLDDRAAEPVPAFWLMDGLKAGGPVTGRDGTLSLAGLVPGARYRLGIAGLPAFDFRPAVGERVRFPTLVLGGAKAPR